MFVEVLHAVLLFVEACAAGAFSAHHLSYFPSFMLPCSREHVTKACLPLSLPAAAAAPPAARLARRHSAGLSPCQTIKLLLLLLPLLVLGCLAALLLLALQHGQISTNSLLDLITPPTQQLPPYPILIGTGGEPLLLPDHRPLGVIPVTPAPGVLDGQGLASGFMLVAGGRQLKGRHRLPLRLVLGGAGGNVLLDEDGLPMLGPGGRPLEVRC